MLELINIPTEQTTAATDAVLAVVAAVSAVYLHRIGKKDRGRSVLWAWVFILLFIAAVLGTAAHGFKMPSSLNTLLWPPIYLSLALLVTLFVVAVVHDIRGGPSARRLLPFMLSVGTLFFCITLVWPDGFLPLVVYGSMAMVFSFGEYILLGCRSRLDGAWLMASGLLTTAVAVAVQASARVSFTLIWPFDHNGANHLIQLAGIGLLLAGLRKSFSTDA